MGEQCNTQSQPTTTAGHQSPSCRKCCKGLRGHMSRSLSLDTENPRRSCWCVAVCVAVCCSVLQCVAVCFCVLQCVAVCCSALPCVAACCSVLQCVDVASYLPSRRVPARTTGVCVKGGGGGWLNHWYVSDCNTLQRTTTRCNTLQRTTTHCNTLQHPVCMCTSVASGGEN